jgi:hypothetical protein
VEPGVQPQQRRAKSTKISLLTIGVGSNVWKSRNRQRGRGGLPRAMRFRMNANERNQDRPAGSLAGWLGTGKHRPAAVFFSLRVGIM